MDDEKTLSADDRLHKRSEFLRVYAKGARVHSRSFVLYVLPRPEGPSRLGLTVSTRVGSAVVRNRLKRRLREVFRAVKQHLDVACDIVINTRRVAATASVSELKGEFSSALERWKRDHRRE